MHSSMLHEQQRQKLLRKVEKRIQGLHNEMEFIEILVQFWPLQNMTRKLERMAQRMRLLEAERQRYLPDKELLNVASKSPPVFQATPGGHYRFPSFVPT